VNPTLTSPTQKRNKQKQRQFVPNQMEATPREIQLLICTFLDFKSLARLSRVNRYFHTLANQPLLWKNLCHEEFGNFIFFPQIEELEKKEVNVNWKEVFQKFFFKTASTLLFFFWIFHFSFQAATKIKLK
jgi:hypothetical protein